MLFKLTLLQRKTCIVPKLSLRNKRYERPGSRVVMQRIANPCTSVRFRPGPPNFSAIFTLLKLLSIVIHRTPDPITYILFPTTLITYISLTFQINLNSSLAYCSLGWEKCLTRTNPDPIVEIFFIWKETYHLVHRFNFSYCFGVTALRPPKV